MLWAKSWMETRWRFIIGMALLIASTLKVVLTSTLVPKLTSTSAMPQIGGRLGEMLHQMMALSATYNGYVWSQWFSSSLPQFWVLFAILIGVGGIVTEDARGSALFTLSLPVTRKRLVGTRAALGLLEIAALSIVPSLLIPLISPIMGKSYSVKDALIFSVILAAAGSVFFSFSVLLSSIFTDQIKTVVVGLGLALLLAIVGLVSETIARFSIYRVMNAESYFATGTIPWIGLLVSVGVSGLFLCIAVLIVESRDF